MLSAKVIVLEYVCPTLGAITANQMFAAPYFAVQNAISNGSLGDLNPLPWAFQLGNTIGWVIYSMLIQNYFIFFANLPGFFLSCWFNLAASKLLYQQQYTRIQQQQQQQQHHDPAAEQESYSATSAESPAVDNKMIQSENNTKDGAAPVADATRTEEQQSTSETPPVYTAPTHDYWVLGMIIFWSSIVAILNFADSFSDDTRQLLVGVTVNANLVFFYGAPLSTIAKVLSTRNSATLHVPTMLTNTANGVFWTCYGFAVLDYFIYVPNGLGALLGGIQIFLYMVFPRIESEADSTDTKKATDAGYELKAKDEDIA